MGICHGYEIEILYTKMYVDHMDHNNEMIYAVLQHIWSELAPYIFIGDCKSLATSIIMVYCVCVCVR